MNAAKKIRKLIEKNPQNPNVATLVRLAAALELGEPFDLADLYDLPMAEFDLALALICDWRLDRYINSRNKLGRILRGESVSEDEDAAAPPSVDTPATATTGETAEELPG